MTSHLNEQFEELGKTVNLACIGAARALEDMSVVKQTKRITDSLKMLQSQLLILKTKDEYSTFEKHESSIQLPPHDQTRAELNDAITIAKLQQLAWETAKESFIFVQYSRDLTETADSNRKQLKTEIAEAYLEHQVLAERLHALINRRSEKLARASEKTDELNDELKKFKNMLSTKRQLLLNTREKENYAEVSRKEDQILTKLDSINISRMVIVNILGVSGINFMKYPQWADIIVKCRKPVTMENLESYTV